MIAERVKTILTTEEVSSRGAEKSVKRCNWHRIPSGAVKKPGTDWQMDLQTYEAGRK
jgi:hypothetical protein